MIRAELVQSAHDCSEGGLAVALAESCFNPKQRFGAEIDLGDCGGSLPGCAGETPATTEEILFNESQSRVIISVAPENLEKTISILSAIRTDSAGGEREGGIPFQQLGKVGGDQLRIQIGDQKFAWPIADLYDDWWNSIHRLVESDSSAERIPSL